MRLAILSDVHGNLLALEAVLDDLKQAGGADKTWVLGDLCLFGPRPAECLQCIRDIPDVKVISGNTDRYLVKGTLIEGSAKDEAAWNQMQAEFRADAENMIWAMSKLSYADYEYLSKLHHGLDENVEGYGWAIGYHGSPGNDEYYLRVDTPEEEVLDQFLDQSGRLGFGGHTHQPMDRMLGAWRVINVGSVGMPKDEPRACYVIATFTDDSVALDFRRVEFDVDAVIADLRQQGHPAPDWIEKKLRPV